MGPPGSGKGTQSKLLQEKLGLVHLSTGDMFRQAIVDKTAVGLKAKGYMDRGEYVPDQVVIDVIGERLQQKDTKNGFILDGFPRTEPQALALDQLLAALGVRLDKVFFFDVNPSELVKRLSSRRTCRSCQRIVTESQLSIESSKICSKTPTQSCDFYQRDDDRSEVVENRIKVYQNQTMPVLDFYRNRGQLDTIDGTRPPADVFSHIQSQLKA
jgi:adenylate kinase